MQVVLRPVQLQDLEVFESNFYTPEGVGPYQWFGHRNPERERQLFNEHGLLHADGGTMSVLVDEQIAGRVEWFRSTWWGRPDTSWCWTIAIGLCPFTQGKGIGTLAQKELAAYLFLNTRTARVQAFTDAENVAERRSLLKCGFVQEGVARRAQWRDGLWHDQALYSLLRDEWSASR